MTNEFLVHYASGVETTFHSTCASVAEFCNEHFGSTWEEAKALGACVTMNGGESSAPEPEAAQPDANEPAPEVVAEADKPE